MLYAVDVKRIAQRRNRGQEHVSQTAAKTDPIADERALIEAAANGDRVAFRRLYDHYFSFVVRNVARLVGQSSELEDIVQDVFVQVHRSLDSFRFDCAFTTWLYRVTRNVTISHIRKRPSTVELKDWRNLRADNTAWSKLEARAMLRVLNAALENVSVEYREAFLLHEIDGMKLREIAELTGESINTVAARVRRTREKLQATLETNVKELRDE
jgi:RNA polymerase sigma-70 factor (ECF subfamily)